MSALRFLQEFLARPADVGAFAPSGRDLALAVVNAAEVAHASVVVEFGPGTGAITQVILEHLTPGAKFFAIEINPNFAQMLKVRFPHVQVVHDSATNTQRHLQSLDEESCDCIVSGLPWAAFKGPLQDALLDAVSTCLRPGGHFATYMYLQSQCLPSAHRFKHEIARRFSSVSTTPIVWRNFPPAIVYHGVK
ncbi:MAG TPA: methyltransferase domain-containing protein [Candidatus Hydrogenedentes bacterium]|nr:methyltransferase domain-containing protein [Candidatus Hydrogenedentota bacterium]HOS03658.1 methyltransferase domain-containing protein [Candidatus Hydrogenedentota bacterium]